MIVGQAGDGRVRPPGGAVPGPDPRRVQAARPQDDAHPSSHVQRAVRVHRHLRLAVPVGRPSSNGAPAAGRASPATWSMPRPPDRPCTLRTGRAGPRARPRPGRWRTRPTGPRPMRRACVRPSGACRCPIGRARPPRCSSRVDAHSRVRVSNGPPGHAAHPVRRPTVRAPVPRRGTAPGAQNGFRAAGGEGEPQCGGRGKDGGDDGDDRGKSVPHARRLYASYSAALLNTTREHRRTGRRTPETGRNGRDTPRLYALYSVVFRCHLHTKAARKPYSRKGFRKCIQCIQRIPTPFVFRLSLLLEPEYMNTVNRYSLGHPA